MQVTRAHLATLKPALTLIPPFFPPSFIPSIFPSVFLPHSPSSHPPSVSFPSSFVESIRLTLVLPQFPSYPPSFSLSKFLPVFLISPSSHPPSVSFLPSSFVFPSVLHLILLLPSLLSVSYPIDRSLSSIIPFSSPFVPPFVRPSPVGRRHNGHGVGQSLFPGHRSGQYVRRQAASTD